MEASDDVYANYEFGSVIAILLSEVL